MKFGYENQGTNTYLTYKMQTEDVIDTMSLGMITNNVIQGLAPALFVQMDSDKYIKYNVSAKISIEQFFIGNIKKERIVRVFQGIVNAILTAENYMIEQKSILLDTKHVFIDVSTYDVCMICIPFLNRNQTVDLDYFFKNIMFTTQFDQSEDCNYVMEIINYLNNPTMFSLKGFNELLIRIMNNSNEYTRNRNTINLSGVKKNEEDRNSRKEISEQDISLHNNNVLNVENCSADVKKIQSEEVGQYNNTREEIQNNSKKTKMRMFNLLMHYSKENVALYKEQKQQKKTKGVKKPSNKKDAQNTAFAIPGQNPPDIKSHNDMVKEDGEMRKDNQSSQILLSQQKNSYLQKDRNFQNTVFTNEQNQQTPIKSTLSQPIIRINTNFGETTVLGGGVPGETTVLTAAQTSAQQPAPYIIRQKNNEKIPINKPRFRIGKEKSYVDYFIGDNTAISRSHADIVTVDNTYFIIDMNSTNHTFINGNMIQSGDQVQMNHGDILKLANEEFEFRIY